MTSPVGDTATDTRAALAAEVRALVLAAGVSGHPPEELDQIRAELARLRARLEAGGPEQSMRRGYGAVAEAHAAGVSYRLSPYNPFAIPLTVSIGTGAAWADLIADVRHEGPPGCLHGGVSAWLMDSMLGLLLQAQGRHGVTASLHTRYHARTPLGVPLRLRSQVVRSAGRKIWIEGSIEADGVTTVSAEGLFIEVPGPHTVSAIAR